jgi:hypothetical protein
MVERQRRPGPIEGRRVGSRRRCGEDERRAGRNLEAAGSADRIGQRERSAEASIMPELAKVVAVTVPNPSSVDPAASVSDALDPVEVSVPPPSWITPSLAIAAFAVVQLRPARSCSSPLAPMVRSVLSMAQ